MSAKTNKKVRQMFRREVRQEAIRQISHWNDVIKPKPKWMPAFFYRMCVKVVLK